MKKRLLIWLMTVLMSLSLCLGLVACNKPNLTKLGKVTLSIEGDMAVWTAVSGASRYAYQIDDEQVVETTLRAVQLEDGESIKVKAVGDGIQYQDGDYCTPKTYTAAAAITLGAVTVNLDGCVARWNAVQNATRYAYQINDGTVVETTARNVVLQNGESIKVKAVGDGKVYTDGAFSASVTYNAPTMPQYTTLVVKQTINEGDTLLLSEIVLVGAGFAWKSPNTQVTASGYYEATYTDGSGTVDAQIYIDLEIRSTSVTPPVVTVPDYTTVVVQAEKKESETLLLSQITLPAGFAWKNPNAQVTASGYYEATYTDGNGTVEATAYIDLTIVPTPITTPAYTTVVVAWTIAEGETLHFEEISLPQGFAWATPNGVVTESGYYAATYTDANGSVAVEVYIDLTITPVSTPAPTKLGKVTLTLTGDMATWAALTGASRYAYQINDGEVVETTLRAVQLQDGDSIKVKAIGDGVAYADGDYCTAVTYTAPPVAQPTKLGQVTVTISGHTATWTAVAGASRYAYQINGGEVVETTLRSVTLNAGDTIQVKAIGDGVNYADGDYSQAVTHATIYDGPISDVAVATINALEKVADAQAAGPDLAASGVISTMKAHGNAAYYVGYWQKATLTIPMLRNGTAMTADKLRLYDYLTLSVMISGDDVYSDAVRENAPTIKVGSQVFTPDAWVSGWNDIKLNVETLIADGYTASITVEMSRPIYHPAPANGYYMLYFDNLAGVYKEKLDLGNVMVFGDSYSTYEGYIQDPRFYYYADKAVSQTDVTSVTQTWWGQLIAGTTSNLLMNHSISGSTVAGYTYGVANQEGWPPQDTFFERIDALSAKGPNGEPSYFETHDVDTILMYGGTNDAWGQCSPNFGGQYTLGEAKYSGWTVEDLNYVLPAYCYFIDKALRNTDADIVVILNAYEVMSRNLYNNQKYDVQSAIINAVKGFAEYGTRIQIVALNNNEHNDIDISIGDHPTVMGMGAIKDQILNALYERKYLSMDKWTPTGSVSAAVTEQTVFNSFNTWDVNNSPYMLGDATGSVDMTTTADGDGSWAVKASWPGSPSFVICHITNSFAGYQSVKLVVIANEAASGITLYMDDARTKALGTLVAGRNEFTVATKDVVLTTNSGGITYFAVFFVANSSSATLNFDSFSGEKSA